jgi:hypothetical protein
MDFEWRRKLRNRKRTRRDLGDMVSAVMPGRCPALIRPAQRKRKPPSTPREVEVRMVNFQGERRAFLRRGAGRDERTPAVSSKPGCPGAPRSTARRAGPASPFRRRFALSPAGSLHSSPGAGTSLHRKKCSTDRRPRNPCFSKIVNFLHRAAWSAAAGGPAGRCSRPAASRSGRPA